MAIAFSRSMRSLKSDSNRFSMFGLLLSIILILVWMIWFFMAKIGIYEVSKDVRISEEGYAVARFQTNRIQRMEVGQPALLQIEGNFPTGTDGNSNTNRTLTAQAFVFRITPDENTEKQALVELVATDESVYPYLYQSGNGTAGPKITVQIEIERVTPFTLVQRASRQYFAISQYPSGAAIESNVQ